MAETYTTAQVAKMIGIHVNTVRLYEELGLVHRAERKKNGYRMFTPLHVEQFRLARLCLRVEVLQNGLRKQAVNIVKTAAAGDLNGAQEQAEAYLQQIRQEQKNAGEAIKIAGELLFHKQNNTEDLRLTRKQTAVYLGVTIDTLRNWELNGLLCIKRRENGYRVYTGEDIRRLKIIRALRCANYSLSAILRLLSGISRSPEADIKAVIDTPEEGEDIVSLCDKLLTSLQHAEENAQSILMQLQKMKK